MINDVCKNINTPALMETNLGIKNIPLLRIDILADATAPIIYSSKGLINAYTNEGNYTTSIIYNNTDSYDCFYKIQEGTIAPNSTEIRSCNVTTNCGNFTLTKPGYTIQNKIYPNWKMGLEYAIFFVCFNRVPNAILASNIVNAFTFTPTCPAGVTLLNYACEYNYLGSKNDSFNTNTTSGFRLKMKSFYLILFLLFYLLV